MGKWTLEYHDEVLRNKLKNLVQGAIKRMKVEKDGPSITYESFVEELDEGDSFTTSLVDVLVKELAERRTRPNPADRRLISERTAKNLRMQAAPSHVYRGSQGTLRDRARRSIPIPPPRPYSTYHDTLSDSDGDEEYGTMLASAGPLEGAQINTDLYDAYASSTYDLPGSLSRSTDRNVGSPHPPEHTGSWITTSPPPRSPSTGYNTAAWNGLGGAPSGALSRQPTIRRSHRPRPTDSSEFAGFTSRRRSAIRSSTTQDDGPRAESSTDPVGRSSSAGAARSVDLSSAATDTGTGRSLDLSAWMARRLARASPFGITPSSVLDDLVSAPSVGQNQSSSQMWYSMTASSSTSPEPISLDTLPRRSSTTDINEDRRQVVAPRLRRGGLRPPESLPFPGPSSSTGTGTPSLVHSTTELPSQPLSHDSATPDSTPAARPESAGAAPVESTQGLPVPMLASRSTSPGAESR